MYLLSHPGVERLNYVREQLVFGVAYRPILDLRLYGEANWAFHEDGGAQPWEFQFGIDYSPGAAQWVLRCAVSPPSTRRSKRT